jgi:hypothetical protein
MSALSSDQTKASADAPFHLLMSGDSPSIKRGTLDRTLRGDYLSQRYRAFHEEPLAQKEDGTANGKNDPIWLGVSPLEQALASCCELPVKGPEALVGGSLVKEKVLRFVGVLALHCHDIGARSVALAILERSMQVDEEERLGQVYYATLSGSSDTSGVDTAEPSPKKRRRRRKDLGSTTKEEEEEEDDDSSEEKSSSNPVEKSSQNRIEGFLAAGGLLLLSRWLVEATAPVNIPKPKPAPGTTGRAQRSTFSPAKQKPASTGPLLLPLLAFLSNISFDRQLVTQSKINKEIRKLSKQIDEIVQLGQDGQQKVKVDAITHPVAGGLPVVQVQKALNDLKESWGAKAKNAGPDSSTPIDPFAALKDTLKERLDTIIDCEAGRAEKPAWLAKLEDSQKEKEKRRPKSRSSTEQLAKKERANERSAMMKEDLRKAAQERSELLRKLREMEQKREVDSQMDLKRQAQARKGVTWKDGLGAGSMQRQRDLLEEVFVLSEDKAELGRKVEKQALLDLGEAEEDASIDPEDGDEDLFAQPDIEPEPEDVEEDLFGEEDEE